ncbi:hypothetical protein [Kineosporia succinea]|uniref:DUF2914 domain-containing protein n=1 Tax=Kineosporia succinea TaxID=84632 RepID=A0ABT9NX86_9ACTN|nr:hypothetical protein [Kineosporia succinea]MDP9825040.1 hypothetical protein [Kineosporia succinea]
MGGSDQPADPNDSDDLFTANTGRRPVIPVQLQYFAVAVTAVGLGVTTLWLAGYLGERRPSGRAPTVPVERAHPVQGLTEPGADGDRGPQTLGTQIATTAERTSVSLTLDDPPADGGVCVGVLWAGNEAVPIGAPACFTAAGQTRVLVPSLAPGTRFRLVWYRPGSEGADRHWAGTLRFNGEMTDAA